MIVTGLSAVNRHCVSGVEVSTRSFLICLTGGLYGLGTQVALCAFRSVGRVGRYREIPSTCCKTGNFITRGRAAADGDRLSEGARRGAEEYVVPD